MALDDAPHAGQADAGALELFHAMQALEYAEQLAGILHVEADAVVPHVDHDLARALFCADLDHRDVTGAAVLHRVVDEVA